jgi:hypothetical protein
MKGNAMPNWTGWIIGGGLATLITSVTALISALHAHNRISALPSQQAQSPDASQATAKPQ